MPDFTLRASYVQSKASKLTYCVWSSPQAYTLLTYKNRNSVPTCIKTTVTKITYANFSPLPPSATSLPCDSPPPTFPQAWLTSPQITLFLFGWPPGVSVLLFHTHKHISCLSRIVSSQIQTPKIWRRAVCSLILENLTYPTKTNLAPQSCRYRLLEVLFLLGSGGTRL